MPAVHADKVKRLKAEISEWRKKKEALPLGSSEMLSSCLCTSLAMCKITVTSKKVATLALFE
jgi:hypothetical protein